MINQKFDTLLGREEALDGKARLYLDDRTLSVPMAIKCGIFNIGDDIGFAYRSNGEIKRYKFRSMKDKKKQWFCNVEGDKSMAHIPFFNQVNWPEKDFLIITEGEFDCLALMQLIGRNVVSLPMGANSVKSTFVQQYEYLQDYQTIYVAFDMDDSGERAAKEAMSLIPPAKYRRIIFPCKDANEWVDKHSPVYEEDLKTLMENSVRIEDKAFTLMFSLDDSVYEKIDLGIRTGWKSLDAILGGIRTGEVTVVSADTGSGKSTFCLNLMYNIADQDKGIWINSYEMSYKIVARKLSNIVLRRKTKYEEFSLDDKLDFKRWLADHSCYINTSTSKVDLNSLRKQFEMAAYAYDIKYILIDHLDYIHSTGKNKNVYENIDEAMREIHSLAMEFNVAVILVVHPKQLDAGKETTIADLKGSSGIKQFADNIIILTRMDRFDVNDINRVKVRVWKNRLCGIEKAFFLRYLPDVDCYVEGV